MAGMHSDTPGTMDLCALPSRATLMDESPSPAFFSLALAPPPARPADPIEHGVGVESEKSRRETFYRVCLGPKHSHWQFPYRLPVPTESSVQILSLPRRGNDTHTGSSFNYQ